MKTTFLSVLMILATATTTFAHDEEHHVEGHRNLNKPSGRFSRQLLKLTGSSDRFHNLELKSPSMIPKSNPDGTIQGADKYRDPELVYHDYLNQKRAEEQQNGVEKVNGYCVVSITDKVEVIHGLTQFEATKAMMSLVDNGAEARIVRPENCIKN